MITNCPVCGKSFDVLWPHLWRYKRNNAYLCSWKCLRLTDKRKKEDEMNKPKQPRPRMTSDEMAEAVRMWKANDPGLDQYLTDHGITNIGKWKQNARDRYGVAAPATVKVDGPLRIETPEANKIEIVETPEDPPTRVIKRIGGKYEVSAIRVQNMGEFYYDIKYNSIDWRTSAGDEVSLSPIGWKNLAEELPDILTALGAKV